MSLPGSIDIALSPKGREASVEVPDVSREFPLLSILKFFVSG